MVMNFIDNIEMLLIDDLIANWKAKYTMNNEFTNQNVLNNIEGKLYQAHVTVL